MLFSLVLKITGHAHSRARARSMFFQKSHRFILYLKIACIRPPASATTKTFTVILLPSYANGPLH